MPWFCFSRSLQQDHNVLEARLSCNMLRTFYCRPGDAQLLSAILQVVVRVVMPFALHM